MLNYSQAALCPQALSLDVSHIMQACLKSPPNRVPLLVASMLDQARGKLKLLAQDSKAVRKPYSLVALVAILLHTLWALYDPI